MKPSPPLTWIVFWWLFLIPLWIRAHDPGLSSVTVSVSPDSIQVVATFSSLDYAIWTSGAAPGTSVVTPGTSTGLIEKAFSDIHLPVRLQFNDHCLNDTSIHLDRTPIGDMEYTILYRRLGLAQEMNAIRATNILRIQSLVFSKLPSGHRQILTVLDQKGESVSQKILRKEDAAAECSWNGPLNSSSPSQAVWSFLVLGIHHILGGYDHLLFLFVLLLACPSIRSAILLVTTFTVAHSFTLFCAASGALRLPASMVEPAIAASIIYAAVENLWKRGTDGPRLAVVFGFGLIHGVGFASVLEEFHLGSGMALVRPLIGFNAGAELGQLGLVLLVLPWLLRFRKSEAYLGRWMPMGSLACAMVGAAWLVQRLIPA